MLRRVILAYKNPENLYFYFTTLGRRRSSCWPPYVLPAAEVYELEMSKKTKAPSLPFRGASRSSTTKNTQGFPSSVAETFKSNTSTKFLPPPCPITGASEPEMSERIQHLILPTNRRQDWRQTKRCSLVNFKLPGLLDQRGARNSNVLTF